MQSRIALIVVALSVAGSVAVAAGALPYPSFWPARIALQQTGFDYWRVWQTRCEVSRVPTSPYNVSDRQAVMMMWIAELVRQKAPVDDVAPRRRVSTIAQMITTRRFEAAGREVDAIFRGLEEMMAGKEYVTGRGAIVGKVIDEVGAPVSGADVAVFGTPLGAITDERGRFRVADVPCASPRYIVRVRKHGYVDGYAGDINPQPDRDGETAVILEKLTADNAYRSENLAVKLGYIVEIKQTADPTMPVDTAVIDAEKYPETVKPYLKPSATINCDDPAVVDVAQQILASLPEADRGKSTAVAKAVYGWVVRNIEYDVMANYGNDPTCGNWQTTFGGWGRDFDDWCYTPPEVLAQRRAICIEYERLAAALLRALDIPARPAPLGAHPVCQWWVQLPTGNGYWANMETSIGRNAFKLTGSLDAKFPSVGDDRIAFYGVDERAPIHVAWNAAKPCLWLEDYGERARTARTEHGLKIATRWLATFGENGRVPAGAARGYEAGARSSQAYMVISRGAVINLASLGPQRKLTVRFPIFLSNQYRATIKTVAWTNHPEWVKDNERRERQENELTGEALEWHCIDFELGAAPEEPPAEAPAPEAG